MDLNYIKGVNLGNWLVLEKWMNPALFDGTTADDEYYLPTQLDPAVYEARIRTCLLYTSLHHGHQEGQVTPSLPPPFNFERGEEER